MTKLRGRGNSPVQCKRLVINLGTLAQLLSAGLSQQRGSGDFGRSVKLILTKDSYRCEQNTPQ